MKSKKKLAIKNATLSSFIENFSYTFSSNVISMFISVITVLLVPKLIGVTDYGYWQLYLLYVSYTAMIQLGWCDGIYLRYGGINYEKLNKKIISSQFWYLALFYLVISFFIITIIYLFLHKNVEINILLLTFLSGFLTTPRGLLYYILQATNNIKKFAKITILDRLLFIIFLIFFLFAGITNYEILIISDLLGKFISFIVVVYVCRDLVFTKVSSLKVSLNEMYKNISVGFKLMIANIASMLIIGIVRFSIENKWGIETFGKISLTLSISNLFLIFINAIGIVMFPMLRRTSKEKLPSIYKLMRTLLMAVLLLVLVMFIPIKIMLLNWLPQYTESLNYMSLLLPLVVFESKMSMLINTYLKTFRKEKVILFVNIAIVILSLIVSYITVYIFESVALAMLGIVILLAIRCIIAELYIASFLKLSVIRDIILEVLMASIFIASSWFIGGWLSTILYSIFYFVYLFFKKEDLIQLYDSIKHFFYK